MVKSNFIPESELAQGSDEWRRSRLKAIGSSDISTIMGVNPYSSVMDLYLEKTGQVPQKDLSKNFFVQRGTALEPIARDLFNYKMGMRFEPATFQSVEYEMFRYSSDGYDRDANEIIEIKSMGDRNHNKVIITGEWPAYYFHQFQWGLMVSGAQVCHFIAYNPSFEQNMFIKEVYPDETVFKEMTEKALWFWDCVVNLKEPIQR